MGDLSKLKNLIKKISEFDKIHQDLMPRVDRLQADFDEIEEKIDCS